MRPVLKCTLAVLTPGSAFSAFSILPTQEGQENSSLRRMLLVWLDMAGSFHLVPLYRGGVRVCP